MAGGVATSSAAELEELYLSPWKYTCQIIGLTQAMAGVAAAAFALHFVWPVRGPTALGGERVCGGGARGVLYLLFFT